MTTPTEPTYTHPGISWDYTQAPPTETLEDLVGLLVSTPTMEALIWDYLKDNFITFQLLTGRVQADNGAYLVQKDTAQKAAAIGGDNPFGAAILPGGAFPLARTGPTTPTAGRTQKIGGKTIVTIEDLKAYRRNAIQDAILQLTNLYSDTVDVATLAAIIEDIPAAGDYARAVISSTTAVAATASSDILTPIRLAKAALKRARLGLKANALVMTDTNFALLGSSSPITTILAFSEKATAVTEDNGLPELAGLQIVTVPDEICVGTALETGALVADTTRLGGLAESIPFRVKSTYNETNVEPSEAFVVSVAHNFDPFIRTPAAGCWVNGLFS